MDVARAAQIRSRITEWFDDVARDLPWRRTDDPYRIWLSEIMLQQTRVDQATPYYERIVRKYPSVNDLARANLDELLVEWEGLGYYARARNMHRAAQMVVREMDSRFPTDRKEMLTLPGVGSYTANAVLSIAHGQPLAVVDGNVARVVSRLMRIEDDPRSAAGGKEVQRIAEILLDTEDPGRFNQAMMEFGATVCLPRRPTCDVCPVRRLCDARAADAVSEYPVRRPRKRIPEYEVAVAVIRDGRGRVFIQRRPDDGLLGGLWEFPGGKLEDGEPADAACRREVNEEVGLTIIIQQPLPAVHHAYSHFKVHLHPFLCRFHSGSPVTEQPWAWVETSALRDYAFPRANRKIIQALGPEFRSSR